MAEQRRFYTVAPTPDNGRPTRADLRNILRFGAHVAKVDAELHDLEKRMLYRFADAMGLREEEKGQMLSEDITLAEAMRRMSCPAARNLLLKTMCAVVQADGQIQPIETEFIEKVLTHFTDQVFIYDQEQWEFYEAEVIAEFEQSG